MRQRLAVGFLTVGTGSRDSLEKVSETRDEVGVAKYGAEGGNPRMTICLVQCLE